jgi:hypothetical protein
LSFWLLLSLFKYERTARVSHRFLLYWRFTTTDRLPGIVRSGRRCFGKRM